MYLNCGRGYFFNIQNLQPPLVRELNALYALCLPILSVELLSSE
jgi:hypothetical protein